MEVAKDQKVTSQEVVSNDTEASEEVFNNDLETDETNPRTRLKIRSTRVVLSVGGGEAFDRPSNPNKIIEQLAGVNEPDKDLDDTIDSVNDNDEIEEIDGNIETTVSYDLTISAERFMDAFSSIEENLCNVEDSKKIPFISEINLSFLTYM